MYCLEYLSLKVSFIFDETITGFEASDITVIKVDSTGNETTSKGTDYTFTEIAEGTEYALHVTGIPENGTLKVSVSAGSYKDTAQIDGSSATTSRLRDTTKPSITTITPNGITNSTTIIYNIEFSEPVLGLQPNDIEIINAEIETENPIKFTKKSSTVYEVEVKYKEKSQEPTFLIRDDVAFDQVGNGNTGASQSLKIDIDNPYMVFKTDPQPLYETWAKSHSAIVTISDDFTGLKPNAEIKYAWGTSTEPTTWIEVETINGYTEGTKDKDVTITASGLTGKYYLWVAPINVKDLAGNSATGSIKTGKEYWFDNTIPTIEKVTKNPTDWTNGNVTLTITATDDESGLHEEAYSFDGGVTWQADNYKEYSENTSGIVIQVRDEVGNIATYETIDITNIDKKAPTIEAVEQNPTDWTNGNVTITVIAEDNESGLHEKAYSFDGGKTWQADNYKEYSENTSGISIKVRDVAGNVTIYSKKVNITNIDKTEPIIESVVQAPTEWTNGNVTLTVTAQDNESGLAAEAYSFDGGATWQADNYKEYTENSAGVIIKVRDAVGNITEHEVIHILNIDKTAPIIEKVVQDPTEWTNGNVTLTVTAQDYKAGLATEAYSFDGGATWQVDNYKEYSENTSGIVIKVRDAVGNITTYETIDITNID